MHTHTHVPEDAKAGVHAVGETTEAEALASLKVGENESEVLHGHPRPHSEQMNRVGHMENSNSV